MDSNRHFRETDVVYGNIAGRFVPGIFRTGRQWRDVDESKLNSKGEIGL